MDVRTARRLGEALAGWMERRAVGPTHVARHGKLSRTTVYDILNATGRDVTPAILRKLATGLGHERRRPHPMDETVRDQSYRDLHRATFDDEHAPDELPDTFLETGLYYEVGTMEQAHAWRALIRQYIRLRPDEIARLRPTSEATE